MNLTYWTISRVTDSDAYSLRGKRKKEVLKKFKGLGEDSQKDYSDQIEKRTLEYTDGFNLLDECLSEDRGGAICTESVAMPIPPEYFAGYVSPQKTELPDKDFMEGLI